MSRIFLFGPYPPPYGGISTFVHALRSQFMKMGLDFELKILRQSRGSEGDPVLPEFGSVFRHFRKITRTDICLDSGSLYLEYRSGLAPFAWFFLKLVKRFRWVKVIHDGTLPVRYEKFGFFRKRMAGWMMGFVDEFVVVNDELRRWLRDTLRPRQKVHVIGSLLPLPERDRVAPIPESVERMFSGHSKLVCSIGAFTPDYGFDQVARAVEAIRQDTREDIGLLLIDGGFVLEDFGEYKSSVVRGRDWITVLEAIPHALAMEILHRSDVFVRSVERESYGISRIESLWCGTPVVATPVGETRGMLLYEYGDVNALARLLAEGLFKGPPPDLEKWAKRFEQEAQDNLRAIVSLVSGVVWRS